MFAVVAGAVLFWIGVFVTYFTAQGISPVEFFAGAYERYDPHLGQWRTTGIDAHSGQPREERYLLPEAGNGASYLEYQVRYRDPATGAITKVERPRRIRRRRSRSVRG